MLKFYVHTDFKKLSRGNIVQNPLSFHPSGMTLGTWTAICASFPPVKALHVSQAYFLQL